MENMPKGRKVVKDEIRAALFENPQKNERNTPKKQGNIASLDTLDTPQETKKGKIAVRPRNKVMETTQDVPTPDADTQNAIKIEKEMPIAEEYNRHKEFRKTQKEMARNMFNRAILNDDIALAFDQFTILKKDETRDLEDEKFQLYNLIKKIQLDERKKYDEVIAKFPTEDPKRFVAARRRALIDESLGKYKQALDTNREYVDLPNVVQEIEEDDLPKPGITESSIVTKKNISDAQIEMLPYVYHRALNTKDYLTAYNQVMIAKEVDKEKYTEYSTKMLLALNQEIDALEKIIAEEKEKMAAEAKQRNTKTTLQKLFSVFKKPEPELKPVNEVLKNSEKKLHQFEELKKAI